jgi:hypothetical protein
MKAVINEASAMRRGIHSVWNFLRRKWQMLHRNGIEHSFGDWNLSSDDVEVVPADRSAARVVLRCNGTDVLLE